MIVSSPSSSPSARQSPTSFLFNPCQTVKEIDEDEITTAFEPLLSSEDIFEFVRVPDIHSISPTPIIVVPGGGIFYFWKAGYIAYLKEHFELSTCLFLATSAGALASTALCTGVDIAWASRLAVKLAIQDGAWESRAFLAGMLNSVARRWLEQVIPEEFDVSALNKRIVVVAYRVAKMRLEGFHKFRNRQDFIDCLLASIHIPFYANGRPATKIRNCHYFDGSFGADLRKQFTKYIDDARILVIPCNENEHNKPVSRRECIQRLPPAELLNLVTRGFEYGKSQHISRTPLAPIMHLEKLPPGSVDCASYGHLDPASLENDAFDIRPLNIKGCHL